MDRSSSSICASVALISDGSEDRRLLPSMARKSEVKLLRSPSTRVFGSHSSATSADTLLKLLRREMLNKPRTTTSRKKNKKIKAKWNLIERGCLILADRPLLKNVKAKAQLDIL